MVNIDQPDGAFRARRTATVARALELARDCARAPAGRRVSLDAADALSSELAHHLLPHLESDARLASAIPGAQGARLLAELTSQRRDLGGLIEQLDRVLMDAVHRPRAVGPRRMFEATVGLLERHLVAERELWDALSGATSEETLSTLLREAEAAEHQTERSLRFVWHPPVAPTAAKALWWTSPSTRRVVVLDGAGASGIRHAGDPGQAGREAP